MALEGRVELKEWTLLQGSKTSGKEVLELDERRKYLMIIKENRE